MTFAWSDEKRERLLKLYESGMDFADIATDLGCTRNSAIGMAHRSGFKPRVEKRQPTKVERVVVPPPKKPVIPPKPKVEPLPDKDYRCLIWQLTDSTCRFPMWRHGTDGEFYCGAPGAEMSASKPYCLKHARICNPIR